MHGGAVTLVPLPGIVRLLFACCVASPDAWVQGGTIRVVTLLLFGSTSWFGCDELLLDELPEAPELCWDVPAPPGVRRIVLDGGDGGVAPEPVEPPPWPMHGCTATVSVCALFGTTIVFEPGGGFVSPVRTVSAWSQVGTTMVRSWRWRGITTCRTPGVWSAVETGSPEELLDELLLLPPQAASPRTTVAIAPADATLRIDPLLAPVIHSPPSPERSR